MRTPDRRSESERKHAGGRPPKFSGPRRPVKVANEALAPGSSPEAPVALIRVAPGTEVILVTHSDHLKRIPWLRLVEIAPARFLLSMPSGTAVEALEVALTDLLQEVGPEEARERALLESLRAHLSQLRRDQSMTKA